MRDDNGLNSRNDTLLSMTQTEHMEKIVDILNLKKTYADGFEALKGINLQIYKGEILALLGPNGAGKTTLISIICGITKPELGSVAVNGFDVVTQYRETRRHIGLVPQEIHLEPFSKVADTLNYTRGLFGKPKNSALIEQILRQLSLWEKRDSRIFELSGGMKRRVLIAKALSHEPDLLFLDEPTAGVDVELRKDMWEIVENLKAQGTTIVLTTHYIEEAEAIADRVGIINDGKLLLVEEKTPLIRRLGQKALKIDLQERVDIIPQELALYDLKIINDGDAVQYSYETGGHRTGITQLLSDLSAAGLSLRDIQTEQSSLEDIFIGLVNEGSE